MQRFAGVDIERNVSCALRDGVVLKADIYRPSGLSTELPVLLMRQPYGKAIASTVTYAHPSWYAPQGFMVVIQDVRGRGESEGIFDPFVQEEADGYDAVEWAATLPGSNGKVGMYGFSYQGTTQWAAAAAHPPHLVAISPAMCAADLFHGWFYPHNRFAWGGQLPWAAQLARDEARRRGDSLAQERLARVMARPDGFLRHVPVLDANEIVQYAPYYADWLKHHTYDAYWEARNWLPKLQADCVPALHVGGWFDPFLDGTLQSFMALQSAEAVHSSQHRLLVGPWVHIPWGRRVKGVDYGAEAICRLDFENVRWFRHWLGDGSVGWDEGVQPVRYFELGSGQWRESAEWPASNECPYGAQTPRSTSSQEDAHACVVWRLGNDGTPANGSNGGGFLRRDSEPATGEPGTDVWVYDARLPMACDSYLPVNRADVQERYEILVYTSEPMSDCLSVVGCPTLDLWAESLDGPTEVVAILTQVRPNGEATTLSIGREKVGLTTGEPQHLAITMRPLGVSLQPGTRLRLELTGSAFPLWYRDPNGTDAQGELTADYSSLRIATVAIHHGGALLSRMKLPLRSV